MHKVSNMLDFVIIGNSGFPFEKNASSTKYYLLSKTLKEIGYKVHFINMYNIIKELDRNSGNYDGLDYEFLSGRRKLEGLSEKVYGLIKANYKLYLKIQKLSKNPGRLYILFSYSSYPMLIFLKLLSRLFGFKLILNVWEHHQSVTKILYKQLDVLLFYNHAYHIVDGVISISSFLKEEALKKNKGLPVIIIPPLGDFKFNTCDRNNKSNINSEYFLYCGSVAYDEVILMIVDAYIKLGNTNIKLVLVLSGKINKIENLVKKINNQDIIIMNGLNYIDLIRLYKHAIALLIPLRQTIQDIARFPQKIPEYLLSGRPIITNKVGDVKNSFTDDVNAVFANNYDSDSYSIAMNRLINNRTKADEIGRNGRQFGFKNFHYSSIKLRLKKYLNSL